MRKSLFAAFIAACLLNTGCGRPHPWLGAKETELIGTYKKAKSYGGTNSIKGLSDDTDIQIALKDDHTAIILGLPEFDGFGDQVICKLSGPARWASSGREIALHFDKFQPQIVSPQSPGARQCYDDVSIEITGRFSPYGLYITIGDPDTGTGIELRRVSH
jgi:hypothetical protein